jgi:uncharacterized membrane protein
VGYDAQVTGISNEGTAVGNVAGVEHFIWSQTEEGRFIGNTSENGVSGNTNISADGIFISATVVDPDTNRETGGIYVPILGEEWVYLPGFTPDGGAAVFGMSSGGDFNVGLAWVNAGTAHAAVWEGPGMPTDLGSSVAGRNSRANAVSTNGSVIVGWQDSDQGIRQGAVWRNHQQEILTDEEGNPLGEALAVSGDGKTITGYTLDNGAYIWNETDGITYYSHPNEEYINSISAISLDGKTAVGFSFSPFEGILMGEGFIWFKDSGFHNLDDYIASLGFDTLGITFSVVTAISPNGAFVGGLGADFNEMETKGFIIDISSALSTNSVEKVDLSVFPNPVRDVLNIRSTSEVVSVDVFDVLGKKVMSFNEINSGAINLSPLASGLYIAKLNTETGSKTVKLIKD